MAVMMHSSVRFKKFLTFLALVPVTLTIMNSLPITISYLPLHQHHSKLCEKFSIKNAASKNYFPTACSMMMGT